MRRISQRRRRCASLCLVAACGIGSLHFAGRAFHAAEAAPQPAGVWRQQASVSSARRITAVAFSPDGKTLAVVGGAEDDSGIVKLFDVATQRERLALEGHASWVNAVAFSPDGRTLATGAGAGPEQGEVRLWDAATGTLLMTLNPEGGYVLSLAFSPDGKTLAVGSGYLDNDRCFGKASFWDIASGRRSPLALQGHKGEVTALGYVDGGKEFVTSRIRFDESTGRNISEVQLWNAVDGKQQGVLFTSVGPDVDANFFQMRALAVSADGKQIAGAGRDATSASKRGTLRVWGVNPSSDAGFLSNETTSLLFSVAFSPDGKTLAAGGVDNSIRFWNLTTNREQPPLASFSGAAFALAYSPDGEHLVSGGVAIDSENRRSGVLKWWTRP